MSDIVNANTKKQPVFITIIIALRNKSSCIEYTLNDITRVISGLVNDYEIVIIDNASSDDSVETLEELTSPSGLSNLQVYALTKEIDLDAATWLGMENALGDYVIAFDPDIDDLSILGKMIDKAVSGSDIVFATNLIKPRRTLGYRMAEAFFNFMYRQFNGIDLDKEAPKYRVLSKRVINFIAKHKQPILIYRCLPTAGFRKSYLEYENTQHKIQAKHLGAGIEKGIRLMISTTHAPMRLVMLLSLFGAIVNVIYSLYVVLVNLLVENVAPGWTSLSLQIAGMFFLISLVLLVLGEYVLNVVSFLDSKPYYHISREFTSVKMQRLERPNIEEVFYTDAKVNNSDS